MPLGTIETVASIALAMIPPGNVAKELCGVRRAFWTELGAASARAFFDYPVLSWLARPVDGAALAAAAARSRLPFELVGLERFGDDVFIRIPEKYAAEARGLASAFSEAGADTEYRPGPFQAGHGSYCATLAGVGERAAPIVELMPVVAIRAKTYLLAQIELTWAPDESRSSSWATLSSARVNAKPS
ncbi:MAG TPA: hypothetical protein PLE25_00055 [Spirochaetales bacterium]|nr:hypothetical protein [Spirochaetales bacterium]